MLRKLQITILLIFLFQYQALAGITLTKDNIDIRFGFQDEQNNNFQNSETFFKINATNIPETGIYRFQILPNGYWYSSGFFLFPNRSEQSEFPALEKNIALKAGDDTEILIPFYSNNRIYEYRLNVYFNNEFVFSNRKETNYDAGGIVGVLTDNIFYLRFLQSYFNTVNASSNRNNQIIVDLKKDVFKNPYVSGTSLQYIIIDDFDFNDLNDEEINGFYEYLYRGGSIVFTPAVFKRNKQNNVLKKIFGEYECSEISRKKEEILFFFKIKTIDEIKSYSLNFTDMNRTNFYTDRQGKPIVISKKAGFGNIVIYLLSFDFENILKLAETSNRRESGIENLMKGYSEIMRSLLNYNTTSSYDNCYYIPEEYLISSKNKIFFGLLAVYLFFIGPMQFYILKKRNKLDKLWKSSAIISLIFTLFLVLVLSSSFVSQKKIKRYDLSYYDSDNIVNRISYYLFYTNNQGLRNIHFINKSPVNEIQLERYYSGNDNDFKKHKTSLVYYDTGILLANLHIKNNAGRIFSQKHIELSGARKVEGEFILGESGIKGKIRNKSSETITECALFFFGEKQFIGNLKPGDNVDVLIEMNKRRKLNKNRNCSNCLCYRNYDGDIEDEFFKKYPKVKQNFEILNSFYPDDRRFTVILLGNLSGGYSGVNIDEPDFIYDNSHILTEVFQVSSDTKIVYYPEMIGVSDYREEVDVYKIHIEQPYIFKPVKMTVSIKVSKYILNNEFEKLKLQIYNPEKNEFEEAGETDIKENINFSVNNLNRYFIYADNLFKIKLTALKNQKYENCYFDADNILIYLEGEKL
ncbi:MAG TPA: hypothetical protein PKY81_12580 [bacterium]|nr:hypothetical protein [bacterium]